jgi:cobalt transport protein ATP-binding subunit
MHHKVEISDLSFSYPDGRQALKGINLLVEPGDRVALVGPNGAGKSTLLLQLNGTYLGQGQIEICGIPVVEKRLPQVRAAVGFVFQDPDDQLFSASVYEDVAFGPLYAGMDEAEVDRRVKKALAEVGMSGAEARIPFHLSSGEKRRVAIATVLAMDPEVLALDEPTAGLDPRGRRELIQLLRELPHTMLIATHDMRLARDLMPRMVIMDQGEIVAQGLTSDLLSDRELLEEHGLEQP